MYNRIIVCMALDHGISASGLAVARALKSDGGTITALHVFEQPKGSVAAYIDKKVLDETYETAKAALAERVAGTPDVEPVLLTGHSGRAITDYAAEVGADCIIVGSHKPDLSDYFMGSTASRVARHAPCAVHVVR